MNIVQATTTCLKKYFIFSGRAKRSEFWWFYLFTIIVTVVYTLFVEPLLFAWMFDGGDFNLFIFYVMANLMILLFMIPILAVGSRRLHDIGKSGWWQIVSVIPVLGLILLFVWWASDTKPEGDKYGEAVAETG